MTDKKASVWLLKSAGKYKGYMILLLFLQVLVNGLSIYYALVMKNLVDSAVAQEKEGFFGDLLAFGLLIVFLLFLL